MKNILALTALALGLVCSAASAATLKTTPQPSQGNNYAVFVAGEGTVFDSIQVDIVPQAGITFLNPITNSTSIGKGPNAAFTFRNREMDIDNGWLIGSQTINATTFSYGVVAPGAKIDTTTLPEGRLFLGNVMTSASAQYPNRLAQVTVQLVNEGTTVQTLTGFLPAPEPASFGLASIAMVGGLALRRRRA